MDIEKLENKYNLVTNDVWHSIRELMLTRIVEYSTSSSPDTKALILGMLNFIAEVDKWETDFLSELKRKKDKE